MSNVHPLHPVGADLAWRSPAAAKLGLWLFMGVVSVLFLLLSLAYLARAQVDDWQALAGAPWLPLGQPWRLWLNTGSLLVASAALQWAALAARRGDGRATRLGLGLGGLFAAAFLVGQLWVWQVLMGAGYLLATNPANSFFYLLTGLHGLHLLGGMAVWAHTSARAVAAASRRTRKPDSDDSLPLQLTLLSRYWHFLLVLWLLLFALLASPPENLSALAALCGLR